MIYIYQIESLSPEVQVKFLEACDQCREQVGLLTPMDLRKTIDECLSQIKPLDMAQYKPNEVPIDGSPFMLMNVDDLALDTFLAALKRKKVYIAHKCMVTEKNKNWTLNKLIGDVEEEHAMVTKLMQLQQLVRATDSFPEEEYPPLIWLAFLEKKNMVEDLLKHVGKMPISLDMIDQTFEQFNDGVKMLMDTRLQKNE